jgi:hypothetical protein
MFVDRRLAGKPTYYLARPEDWGMRIPDVLRDCVVFVGRVVGNQKKRMGTGFIVGVESEAFPDRGYHYLVTAGHVARQLSLGGPWFIRFNLKNGGAEEAINPDPGQWWYHPTEPESVDAAVHGIPALDVLDYRYLTVSMFLTADKIRRDNIGMGDEVDIIGLFTFASGTQRNMPILRTGTVAMMPLERIPCRGADQKTIQQSEVYLIEGRSIGGVSGSPAFVRQTIYGDQLVGGERGEKRFDLAGLGNALLLGLMQGHWDISAEDLNEIDPITRPGVNMGIAIVVPAQKILDILFRSELVDQRRKADRDELQRQGLITLDSVADTATDA